MQDKANTIYLVTKPSRTSCTSTMDTLCDSGIYNKNKVVNKILAFLKIC